MIRLNSISILFLVTLTHSVWAQNVTLPDGGVYEGPLVDGRLHGQGTLRWPNGAVYEGQFLDGMIHGKGTLTEPNGAVLSGVFRDGGLTGQGIYRNPNGDRYEGGFQHGYFHGKGSYFDRRGTVYIGEFKQGVPHGRGIIQYSDGHEYVGDIKDWMMSGRGIYTYKSGDRYEGEFKNDFFHGQGKWIDTDGTVYSGQFKQGRLSGKATIRYRDGGRYEGDYEHDMRHGKGEYLSPDGDRYIGQFQYGDFHGQGVLHYTNGDRYEGEFADNLKHGKGDMFYAKGNDEYRRQEGYWKAGRYVGATPPDKKTAEKTQPMEEVLFHQAELLKQHLDSLRAGQPGVPELYYVGFAPYGNQDVFLKEVDYAKSLLEREYGIEGYTLNLINHRSTLPDMPLGTVINLEMVLTQLATRMNPEEDILFLFLTSHGSREHELSVNMPGFRFEDLSATRLKEILNKSGIRWKVILVSACYSGGFVEALKQPETLVMSSASPSTTSFGCGDESEFTYFGRAFFANALKNTTSFEEAFRQARTQVGQWESEQKIKASQPQIAVGESIKQHLLKWRHRLESSLPPKRRATDI